MARDHKTSVRLNAAEHHYIAQYSANQDKSLPDYIRMVLHSHILYTEGPNAAVHLLHGVPPDHT